MCSSWPRATYEPDRGRVTAVSQDAFHKKLGGREQYSNGFAQAVLDLWDRVRGFLPFDTCTMDLLMTPVTQDNVIAVEPEPPRTETDGTAADNDEVPDWLELEKRLQENFSDKHKTEQRKAVEGAAKLPLRGRWCSAF
jgi:hypothetical protein